MERVGEALGDFGEGGEPDEAGADPDLERAARGVKKPKTERSKMAGRAT